MLEIELNRIVILRHNVVTEADFGVRVAHLQRNVIPRRRLVDGGHPVLLVVHVDEADERGLVLLYRVLHPAVEVFRCERRGVGGSQCCGDLGVHHHWGEQHHARHGQHLRTRAALTRPRARCVVVVPSLTIIAVSRTAELWDADCAGFVTTATRANSDLYLTWAFLPPHVLAKI